MEEDFEAFALRGRARRGQVTQVQPAAEIICEVANDARKCINNLVSTIK